MATVKDTLASIVALRREGAISEEEEGRLIRHVIQDQVPSVTITDSGNVPASTSTVAGQQTRTGQGSRQFVGRGEFGWVNLQRAEDLNLVAVLELGGTASRKQRLAHIERRWGQHFTNDDREILSVAREARWRKPVEWAVHYLVRDGKLERVQRGVVKLTASGKQEAQARQQRLP